ncbi:MAG: NADH-quinone oxidoreductase subunit NuoE [Candidatus Stahlbacteria bacterium]|nr:NADH-quinone oxidoreductase subunit NuoE [Candidatus Stahlbacteria bacterium]
MQIDNIIQKHKTQKEALIPILQDIQVELNWLPPEAIKEVAQKLAIPLIDVYGVASFYRAFSLKPRGKHIITVCLGTACHVRGGARIVAEVSRKLNIEPDETTEDMQFTLETVNCLGCCAIGPVVVIDGEYYGGVTSSKVNSIISKYRK